MQKNIVIMIMQLLKEETKAEHEQVEAVSYSTNIMDGSLSLAQYKTIITANYLFNKLVEENVHNIIQSKELGSRFDIVNRQKTHLLLKDIELLGIDISELGYPVIHIDSIEVALGYLYVAEGSTLGGAVIARTLAKNQNLANVAAYHFYGCYGEQTGPMWKNFIIATEATAGMLNNNEAIVAGAKQAFATFGQCLAIAKEHSGALV